MPASVSLERRELVIGFSPQPSVADLLRRLLEDAGFRAVAVWSTVDDLEAAVRRTNPDAIVQEIGFPFHDHWAQFRDARMRGALRHLPIVIATSGSHDLCVRAGERPAFDIFPRPDNVAIVTAAVREAILAARPAHAS